MIKDNVEFDDSEFDLKFNYFENIRKTNKFRSVWSMYEVLNIHELSGLSGETLRYGDHWGEGAIVIPLPGGELQWWDLWVAAEKAINESGDNHHMYIEYFRKKGNDIYLSTGS